MLGSMPTFDRERLPHNFPRLKVPFPTVQPARTKTASVSTADLRGDAEGVTVARFAIKGRVCWYEDALNHGAILQPPKKLLSGIEGALLPCYTERMKIVLLRELSPDAGGQVRHGVPARDLAAVYPMQELIHSVHRLLPGPEPGLEIVTILGLDICLQSSKR